MRECMICGSHEHVACREGVQLCRRCAGAIHQALAEKLHMEAEKSEKTRQKPEDLGKSPEIH